MFNSSKKVYIVYKDGNLILKGYAEEVARLIEVRPSSVAAISKRPKPTRTGYVVEEEMGEAKKINHQEEHYQNIKKMLTLYGNTICKKNVDEITERLSQEGFQIIKTKIKDEDGIHYLLEDRCKIEALKHLKMS